MTTTSQPWAPDFDYLCLERVIIDRLKAMVPALQSVESEASMASLQQGQVATPCAVVLWVGDRPEAAGMNDEPQQVTQVWSVVVIASAAGDKQGSHSRAEAGPVIPQVIRALRGWEPAEGFDKFHWVDGVQPDMQGGGTLYVPLAFRTRFVL